MPSLVLLGFPLVIKERFGSFGEQVYLVNDVEELKQLLTKVGDSPYLLKHISIMKKALIIVFM